MEDVAGVPGQRVNRRASTLGRPLEQGLRQQLRAGCRAAIRGGRSSSSNAKTVNLRATSMLNCWQL